MKKQYYLAVLCVAATLSANSQNITGTTTNNLLLKSTNTSTVTPTAGPSNVCDDGTNVGIGTCFPGYRLDVNGQVNASTRYWVSGLNGLLCNAFYNVATGWYSGNSLMDPAEYNAFLGSYSGYSLTTGDRNTLIGSYSGYTQNTANNNVMIGYASGYNNSTGTENTFLGYNAGYSNTIFNSVTAVGFEAGYTNNTAANTYVGYKAGRANASGIVTAIGFEAGLTNSASNNTFIGYKAGRVTTGTQNTFIGQNSGLTNTTGFSNVYIGHAAGQNGTAVNTSNMIGYAAGYNNAGASNSFIGYQAGFYNTSGADNVFFGKNTGLGTSGSATGSNNTCVGNEAGYTYTSGSDNAYFGKSAGYSNTSGSYNTFVGTNAGKTVISSGNSTFVGFEAGLNQRASNNTIVGYQAGLCNSSTGQSGANSNSFFGYKAGFDSYDGIENTFMGHQAGMSNTTGDHNVAIGSGAGVNNASGLNNIFIGLASGANSGPGYNASIALGANARVTASNQLMVGDNIASPIRTILFPQSTSFIIGPNPGLGYNFQVNGTSGGLSSWNPSDRKLKKEITNITNAMDMVMKLQAVSYYWREDEFPNINFASDPGRHLGFIAQEVEKIVPEAIRHTDEGNYSMNYDAIIPILTQAIKEQQAQITAQKESMETQSKEIEALKQLVTGGSEVSKKTENKITNVKDVELTAETIELDQNNPNPFKEMTTIRYSIPENIRFAQVLFYDIHGKIIKTVDITESGEGQLNIKADGLAAGMYTYSIIVDGNTLVSRKMIKQ